MATGRLSRRRFITVTAGAALLAGCGGPAKQQGTAPTATPATCVVRHAMGETRVPADPARVVALEALDNVLALGLKPIGAAVWVGTSSGLTPAFPSYPAGQTDDIVLLGQRDQPNLERMARLRPDLILGRKGPHEKIYDQLSRIAPTVLADAQDSGDWKQQFTTYAEALGKAPEAEQLMAGYYRRAAELSAKLQARPSPPEVSVLRFDPGRVAIYNKGLLAGTVLDDANVKRPPGQSATNGSDTISLERVDAMDGDVIFVINANPADSPLLQQLRNNELWRQLRAVRSGRVYEVLYEVWIGGWTIMGANRILDDLFRYLLPEGR